MRVRLSEGASTLATVATVGEMTLGQRWGWSPKVGMDHKGCATVIPSVRRRMYTVLVDHLAKRRRERSRQREKIQNNRGQERDEENDANRILGASRGNRAVATV